MSKIPQTISDREWKSIGRRAEKAAPPMFSAEAVRRRKQFSAQKSKANQS